MSRIAKCMCDGCTNIATVAVPIAKRGNRLGFMCHFHAYNELGYSRENGTHYGKAKKHGFTFSGEGETSFSSLKARGEFMDFGWLPTEDATVDVEYKSPIFEGLNAISKQCVSIEKLLASGDLRMGEECGTHFHVGHVEYINPVTMKYLRRFNNSLFVPLSNAIMADTEKSARFFGRKPNGWAEPITATDFSGNVEGWAMKHSAMFNLQHDFTIEFRQPKFVTAQQYMAVARFAKDATDCIIENFIKHFNDTPTDARRYPNKTTYRKHKADVTANKLVKLYEKYTANL